MTYLLLIKLPKSSSITVGNLKTIRFKNGFYLYVGRAKRNLLQRIARHLSKDKKKFWHVDYLLKFSKIIDIWISKNTKECQTALYLSRRFSYIFKFGSSDCKCISHLFFTRNKKDFLKIISNLKFKNFKEVV